MENHPYKTYCTRNKYVSELEKILDGKIYKEKKFYRKDVGLWHYRSIDDRFIIFIQIDSMEGNEVSSSNIENEEEKNSFMDDWISNYHRFNK